MTDIRLNASALLFPDVSIDQAKYSRSGLKTTDIQTNNTSISIHRLLFMLDKQLTSLIGTDQSITSARTQSI